jgi:hypothetical protein
MCSKWFNNDAYTLYTLRFGQAKMYLYLVFYFSSARRQCQHKPVALNLRYCGKFVLIVIRNFRVPDINKFYY